MKRRFVPSHYYRELYQRLQSLIQGTKNVEEYFKEMKLAMIRANVEEDMDATMAIFMNGVNHDIAHIIGLYHYMELEVMVHMFVKVEKQPKRKGTIQQS
jgi:RNA-splicing ligase RtcB